MELAVVFVEIACDDQACERAGRIVTQNLIRDAVTLLTETVNEYTGKPVKTTENQMLCVFPNARKAVQAACRMQQAIYRKDTFTRLGMALKIGSHFGEGTLSKDNVTGEVLLVAKKLRDTAKSGQIIITKDIQTEIPVAFGLELKSSGQLRAKSSLKKIDLFEVLWNTDEEEHTIVSRSTVKRTPSGEDTLVLEYLGKDYIIESGRKSYLMGRGNQNDLIIDEPCVSRGHAIIKQAGGKYKLIDQSTNGTYVSTKKSGEFCLHQAEFVLDDSGIISLGTKIEPGYPFLIHYRMEAE
jgi:adenylate cyclase